MTDHGEREHHDSFYSTDAERIMNSPLVRRAHERMAKEMLTRARLGPTSRILSLGCGDGALERRLAPSVSAMTSPQSPSRTHAHAPLKPGSTT
jgi:cyclopropane fatty-acyl-phospholipid synthase-like methyltransferase